MFGLGESEAALRFYRTFPRRVKSDTLLARQGEHFRRILEPKKGDAIYRLAVFLYAFDIRTAYPLLLSLLEAEISPAEWASFSQILESYLLRRAVCVELQPDIFVADERSAPGRHHPRRSDEAVERAIRRVRRMAERCCFQESVAEQARL